MKKFYHILRISFAGDGVGSQNEELIFELVNQTQKSVKQLRSSKKGKIFLSHTARGLVVKSSEAIDDRIWGFAPADWRCLRFLNKDTVRDFDAFS